ncbi:ABC transporter substrate-binding protein [Oscillatoria sp. FACHB-1407]|uniref:ABC transporter substrate-binding protein n=1 Tax=Oscillatoria sp. FACHB-1407 TaxID=2692847 RepID=UPI001681E29E|nr:ABC transporter substrate-binding protein [Oscillatoria sp. FACHB-1407]MBD2459716.1 ABC transporter substrate-binding protein [Oscillatoria sp. FACHB-1407]
MVQLQLQLDWKPNVQFAGILIAHHLNWYLDHGIELAIVPWRPYLNQVEILKQDGNWLVSTEDNLLIRGRAMGQPVKAIATMMQYSGLGWVALKSSGIRSIQDFVGKRVGIHGDGETGLRISLAYSGLKADQVEIVEVGYDYEDLLRKGEFDATQCLVMVEPFELAAAGLDLQVMPAYEWGYEVYSQVIGTTDRLIAEEPEALQKFLKVTFDGWRYAFANVEDTVQVVIDHYLKESTPDIQQQMLNALKPLFEGKLGLEKLGWMEALRWEKSIHYLQSYGLIDQPVTTDEMMTNQFMEKLYIQ